MNNEILRAARDEMIPGIQLPRRRPFYGPLFERQTSECDIERNSGDVFNEKHSAAESELAGVLAARAESTEQLINVVFFVLKTSQQR